MIGIIKYSDKCPPISIKTPHFETYFRNRSLGWFDALPNKIKYVCQCKHLYALIHFKKKKKYFILILQCLYDIIRLWAITFGEKIINVKTVLHGIFDEIIFPVADKF